MTIHKQSHAEPISGYRLIERLGRGGCGEVWKCEAPGGLFKAVKFVYGNLKNVDENNAAVTEELKAIEHVKSIRHPFLLSIERVECIDGELVIVTELADRNLYQLYEDYRRGGHAGVPRSQLLSYMHETAEVLDLLHFQHDLQHLDVKPQNLFLVYNHIKVGDFGLVNSLSTRRASTDATLQSAAITPLYASPELFKGHISPHCDQYSLAISYQELLTGKLPFTGNNARQLLMQHAEKPPDLEPLPEGDRAIVARALAKDPNRRFPSCMEFIHDLQAAHEGTVTIQVASAKPSDSDPSTETQILPRSDEEDSTGEANPDADTDRSMGKTSRRIANKSESSPIRSVGPYRLVERLRSTPLQEIWSVCMPDGTQRLLKYLYGFAAQGKELDSILQRLRSIQHPILNTVEVVEKGVGGVAVVCKHFERTLRHELRDCRDKKLNGIPRTELLEMLTPIAEGLDYLYRQHSIQHLNLHPLNIQSNKGRLIVDEFGFFPLLWASSQSSLSLRNQRYSAPELFAGAVSPKCDQYSLALIYLEMRIGRLPRTASSINPMGDIDFDAVPEEDREAVARALANDPNQRWGTCSEFIDALAGERDENSFSVYVADQFNAVINAGEPSAIAPDKEQAKMSAASLRQILSQLIVQSEAGEAAFNDEAPAISEDGKKLTHKFVAGLPLGDARLKLDEARASMFGHLVEDNNNRCIFHIDMPRNFLQKWMGLQPGLRVCVNMARQQPLAPTPINIDVEISPHLAGEKHGKELLRDMGMNLLQQVHALMVINSEKRVRERLLWSNPFEICPIQEDGMQGDPIQCRGKDLSLSGIGFYLPHRLETSEIVVNLPGDGDIAPVSIPATLVRAQPCADGWFEVGALFQVTVFRKTLHEFVLP